MEPSLSAGIRAFARGSLRPQRTRVTTLGGLSYTEGPQGGATPGGEAETRGAPGGRTLGFVPDWSVDLQVGVVKPWLLLEKGETLFSYFGTGKGGPMMSFIHDQVIKSKGHLVSHILNVAYGVDNAFPDSYIYKTVTMLDVPDTKLTNYFPECFDFISRAHEQGGVVLVHCNAGVSRAASVVIGYLIQEDGLSFQDAFSLVKRARPAAHPNTGFMQQLSEYNPCQQGQRGES